MLLKTSNVTCEYYQELRQTLMFALDERFHNSEYLVQKPVLVIGSQWPYLRCNLLRVGRLSLGAD